MMRHILRPSAIVPNGFAVENAVCDGGAKLITGRPLCGAGMAIVTATTSGMACAKGTDAKALI